MSASLKDDQWVYIIILNPGKNEKIFALEDDKEKISFIPVFIERDEAGVFYSNIPLIKKQKYEVQAILYEDIVIESKKNDYLMYVLDEDGNIIEKVKP